MKRVLLSGAAGFIGFHLARHLLDQDIEVVGIDNLNDAYDPRLKSFRLDQLRKHPSFKFFQIDVENQVEIERLFSSNHFATVFNLAARAGVGYSLVNPQIYFTTNALGTLNILQAMVRHSVPKLVLASTSSVYAGEPMPFNEDAPVNRPISPYAASKKAAEQLAYTYHFHFGLDCSVVRYFTVFGPAGRPDMSIFRFIRWIDLGEPIEIFGDGNQTRDFTFVDDIARGTLLSSNVKGYEIINLGGGREPVSLKDVISHIETRMGKKAKTIFKPALKADLRESQADIRKAKRLTGWQPEVEFWPALDRTIDWHIENRDFVSRLTV